MATYRISPADPGNVAPAAEPASNHRTRLSPLSTRKVTAPPVACISSGSLLAGSTEVLIEHHGAFYRLKQTSLGKLILTK